MPGRVFFDCCSLSNFASVQRLDLLEKQYGHRSAWTETIQVEVRRGLASTPYLQSILKASWLGDPIEISGDLAALHEIDKIRQAFGGTNLEATKHLGEAEIIFHIEQHERDASFFH